MKSERREGGVFGIEEMEVEEGDILGIVEETAAGCAWVLSVREY